MNAAMKRTALDAARIFTKQDVALLVILSLTGIALSVWVFLPSPSAAGSLEIQQDGKVVKTLPLSEDHQETITSGHGQVNTFSIKGGVVSMESANCGDHTCVRTGTIQRVGESIICLPHRLVLRIIGDETGSGPDTVVR